MVTKKPKKKQDVNVQIEVVAKGKRRTTRRKHKRRTKSGPTRVRKHGLNIGKHVASLAAAGKKLKVQIDKNRQEAEIHRRKMDKDRLLARGQALELQRKTQELDAYSKQLELRKRIINDRLKGEDLTRQQETVLQGKERLVDKEIEEARLRAKKLSSEYNELNQQTLLTMQREAQTASHLARLRDVDEYRRTRIPFKPGGTLSQRFAKLRTAEEAGRIKDSMVSSRAEALRKVAELQRERALLKREVQDVRFARMAAIRGMGQREPSVATMPQRAPLGDIMEALKGEREKSFELQKIAKQAELYGASKEKEQEHVMALRGMDVIGAQERERIRAGGRITEAEVAARRSEGYTEAMLEQARLIAGMRGKKGGKNEPHRPSTQPFEIGLVT